MKRARLICAILLALPLIGFGASYFIPGIEPPPPPDPEASGVKLIEAMRAGGLMAPIAASHVLIGLLLLIPRTRFAAALLQLPMTLGILAFHVTMLPEGTPVAIVMLALNSVVLAHGTRLRSLLGTGTACASDCP